MIYRGAGLPLKPTKFCNFGQLRSKVKHQMNETTKNKTYSHQRTIIIFMGVTSNTIKN